jgi:predicted nucleic acid-binding protein
LIVVDASIALAWSFEDERTPEVDQILERVLAQGAVVPAIWPLEIANTLQMALRRKRIDAPYRDATIQDLRRLLVVLDAETNTLAWTSTLQLSDRFALTAYDASYLELAIRRRLPLATLDRQLADAARASGIEVLP